MIYIVRVLTECKGCAMALAGHAPALKVQGAFVTRQENWDDDHPITIHANSARIQSHDGSPLHCALHGRILDLSKDPDK